MQKNGDSDRVIAVDLDGTLTQTDTLYESVFSLLREKPHYLFAMPFWLMQGKANFKAKVAERVELDVTTLPYNEYLIKWLKEQRASGKKLVLCTATNERIANAVATHLQLFDNVVSSDAFHNIKGANKRKVLEKLFGLKGYDYVGNSTDDLTVWAGAQQAIVVNANQALVNKAEQTTILSKVFSPKPVKLSQFSKILRVHQWVKNVLLFVPMLAAHQIYDTQAIFTLIIAFFSFSLCASATYIINDLLDLNSDRKHPSKRYRPFAAASVPIAMGAVLVPIFVIASLALGIMVGPAFITWLVIYFILTCAYSFYLKRLALIDCLTLAILYTIRIIAGAAAIELTLSMWILAFSLFIFQSLAFLKRYSELLTQKAVGTDKAHGRDYLFKDSSLIQSIGISTGIAATVVLALYLNSDKVLNSYAHPQLTWLAVPLTLFWISFAWLEAHRGKMHDDPVLFAIKNKVSLSLFLLIFIVFVLAI